MIVSDGGCVNGFPWGCSWVLAAGKSGLLGWLADVGVH